jgi:hypothetical protein
MTFDRPQILAALKAHCVASYICVGVICVFWLAIGGADWGTIALLLPFALIVFPYLSLLAVLSLFTGSLGSQELAWPCSAIFYIPLFIGVRLALIHRGER